MTFGDLEVGQQFVDASEFSVARPYQKKSESRAYKLEGNRSGELVIDYTAPCVTFCKTNPVIKLWEPAPK